MAYSSAESESLEELKKKLKEEKEKTKSKSKSRSKSKGMGGDKKAPEKYQYKMKQEKERAEKEKERQEKMATKDDVDKLDEDTLQKLIATDKSASQSKQDEFEFNGKIYPTQGELVRYADELLQKGSGDKGDVKSFESLSEAELQELHGLVKKAITSGEPKVIYKGTSYKPSGAFLTEVDNRLIKLKDAGKKQSEEKSPQQPVAFDKWVEQNQEAIQKNKWTKHQAHLEYDKYVNDFKSKQQNQQQQNKGKTP